MHGNQSNHVFNILRVFCDNSDKGWILLPSQIKLYSYKDANLTEYGYSDQTSIEAQNELISCICSLAFWEKLLGFACLEANNGNEEFNSTLSVKLIQLDQLIQVN